MHETRIYKVVWILKLATGRVVISTAVEVFPGGSQKGISSHDIECGHGQEKRRHPRYVEGNKTARSMQKNSWINVTKGKTRVAFMICLLRLKCRSQR